LKKKYFIFIEDAIVIIN